MRFQMLALFVVSIALVSQPSSGQEPTAIGETAPGFTLQDQNAKPQSLSELLKNSNVALVFHRSADW